MTHPSAKQPTAASKHFVQPTAASKQFVVRNHYRRHIELSRLQLPVTVVFIAEVECGLGHTYVPCLLVSIDPKGDICDVTYPAGFESAGTPVIREHTLFANEEIAETLLLRKAMALMYPAGEFVTVAYGDTYKVMWQTYDYQLFVIDRLGREHTFDPRVVQATHHTF